MSEPTYWGTLPANVRYSDSICANAKLLYCELTCLTNQKGYAWATNAYFAKLYNVHPKTITEWVKELQRAGFIRVEIDPSKGNERRVWMVHTPTPYPVKDGEVSTKRRIPSPGKDGEEYYKGISKENSKAASPSKPLVVEEKKSRKGAGKASLEEVETFAQSIGLPSSDGTAMFYHFEERGWRKNWQATVRKWKEFNYLPSQKQNQRGQPYTPPPSKRIASAKEIEDALMAKYS